MTRKTRSLPPLRLSDSPLVLVLGVIRISPILSMEKFIPLIQEELRQKYPRLRKSETRQIQFIPDLRIDASTKWVFTDREDRTAISVTQNSIALQTTAYETFDAFVERLAHAAEIVGRIATVSELDRLGLRYIDLIRPMPEKAAIEFLSPMLRGLKKEDFRATEMFQRHEFLSSTPEGVLMVRSYESTDQSPLPPDLGGSDLPLKIKHPQGERVVVLDIDHFTEGPRDFDVPTVAELFWRLHDYCDGAFRVTTTDEARRTAWGAVELLQGGQNE